MFNRACTWVAVCSALMVGCAPARQATYRAPTAEELKVPYQSPTSPAPMAQAEPLALKEFVLGAPMADCPPGTITRSTSRGMLICLLGPTTFANQEATSHAVFLLDQKVVGASYSLRKSGRYANGEVLDALIAKFGPPTQNKTHINEAYWFRKGSTLSFDGWKGLVMLLDVDARRRADANGAERNKSDL